jgi:PRTRC genetic system protein C
MSLTASAIQRTFFYNGRALPDPDPTMTPEQVKQYYSAIHAELTNAVVEGGSLAGNTQTFEFRRGIGTKG